MLRGKLPCRLAFGLTGCLNAHSLAVSGVSMPPVCSNAISTPYKKVKKMRLFDRCNFKSGIQPARATIILACVLVATTARASDTPAVVYVPAQEIPCSYGLSGDDLNSAGSSVESAPRPDATVRVWLDERGQISDAVVEQSSGNPAFDNLALQASRRAQCRSYAGEDGKPVAVATNFVFRLPRVKVDVVHAASGVAPGTGNPVATTAVPLPSFSGGAANPSLLATAVPFEFGKALDAAALASRFGIPPDSSKMKILVDWAQKLASDPDIKGYFTSDNKLAAPGPSAFSRARVILDGMTRISQDDREQLMGMQRRALDNAPADCGGTRNLQIISSRYLSLGTESDEALRAQLQAIFNLLKQSTQDTLPPQITAGQQLQGQLALSASMENALKRDPSETEDLGLLMNGRSTDLSPEAWCKAVRFYWHAFDETPQPLRDWLVVGGIERMSHSISMFTTMFKKLALAAPVSPQQGAAPKVFDYAELVRQRVRPNIVWSGKSDQLETVVEVRCAPSGNLESVRVVRSSGDKAWDQAALEAVRRSDPMPLDENGRAPASFTITLIPGR
jgi:TonB family protein